MRQPNVVDHVAEDAQALLRAAQEIHGERHGAQTFAPGVHLLLERAAERTGIRSNGIHYHDAVAELEYEGAIEWDTSARYARGNKHYVITRRGMDDLGRARGGAIQEGQEKLFEG
jgi:hypothetical protein